MNTISSYAGVVVPNQTQPFVDKNKGLTVCVCIVDSNIELLPIYLFMYLILYIFLFICLIKVRVEPYFKYTYNTYLDSIS